MSSTFSFFYFGWKMSGTWQKFYVAGEKMYLRLLKL